MVQFHSFTCHCPLFPTPFLKSLSLSHCIKINFLKQLIKETDAQYVCISEIAGWSLCLRFWYVQTKYFTMYRQNQCGQIGYYVGSIKYLLNTCSIPGTILAPLANNERVLNPHTQGTTLLSFLYVQWFTKATTTLCWTH